MKKKKGDEMNKKNNISTESAQIQVARLFYRMIDIISNDIVKDDNVCEHIKSEIFESTMINYDELPLEVQHSYIIASNAAWCAGMSILKTLLELNENNNKEGK